MNPENHIIGRQKISVNYRGKASAQALRDMIHRVCRNELPARLNKLLDDLVDPSDVIRIGKLQVRIDIGDDGSLEEKLGRAVIEEIELALRRELSDFRSEAQPADQSFGRALAFYLANGFLPWWSSVKEREHLKRALDETWTDSIKLELFWSQIKSSLREASARKRLNDLIDEEKLEALIRIQSGFNPSLWKEIHSTVLWIDERFEVEEYEQPLLQKAQELLLESVSSHSDFLDIISEFIRKYIAAFRELGFQLSSFQRLQIPSAMVRSAFAEFEINERTIIPKEEDEEEFEMEENPIQLKNKEEEKDDESPEEQNGISVFNSGLVLIAPYLPRFFENLGICKENKLIDPGTAAVILRHLVFPNEPFEEFDLVLEKLLCGIPLQHSIPKIFKPGSELNEQINELLSSVIENWPMLKNTSPEGLRQSFLQREGRLSQTEKHWNMDVQRESFDLLLEHVSWNFRMIKLPWMNKLLQVNWG